MSAAPSTVHQLQSAVDAMQGSLYQQLAYLALHADPTLMRATFADWVPAFALSGEGLVFALVFAIVAWLAFHALWWLLGLGSRLLFGRRHRAPWERRARDLDPGSLQQ